MGFNFHLADGTVNRSDNRIVSLLTQSREFMCLSCAHEMQTLGSVRTDVYILILVLCLQDKRPVCFLAYSSLSIVLFLFLRLGGNKL